MDSIRLAFVAFLVMAGLAFFLAWIVWTTPDRTPGAKRIRMLFFSFFDTIGAFCVYGDVACLISIILGRCVEFPLLLCP